jgi:GNAT superfamily N-acetyltransferase
MHIRPADTPRDIKEFVELPYSFYRDDPMWVPPLRSEQANLFDPHRNPLLQHCDWQLFLLEDGERVVGRVAAFIDHLAVEAWGEPVGLFGHYECPPDETASRLLLTAAHDWLQQRGMRAMRGPWSFVSQEWGLVLEGFSPPPVIMAPYNPAYYNHQMMAFGLQKIKDLLCYEIDVSNGYKIPSRILELTDVVARRYRVRVRQLDMRHYDREVRNIIELSNLCIIDNWGFSPVTEAEVQAMAHDLKPVLQPRGVLFAEDANGRPIGFAIALPDVNALLGGLNGRLFPLGWIKLLWGLPRLRRYRMFALGVIPEYQGKAVDSLLYRALHESLYTPDTWMEINYVLEDNYPMNNAIRKLGAHPSRRYRIYQAQI